MVKQVWGKHATVATGTNDTGKQVSVNVWNESLNRKGLLGFDSETIASASEITIPEDTSSDSSDGSTSSFIKLSGVADVDKFIVTNTTEGDLLYLITTGSATLVNVTSPSSGEIRLLGDDDKDLSTTVPTILMRIGNAWYEYGGSPVTDGSVTNTQLANMAANTIKVRNAVDAGVPSDVAVATTQLLIGNGTGFTAAALSGDVSMDNTGDVTVGTLNQSTTGSSASCTGLSATATALATGRAIGGTSFDGTAAIDIVEITVADTTDTTCSVALFESATGTIGPKSDAGLTYNAGTGTLTATAFAGPLTGNVTGDATGSSGSTTGNAATVTTNANLTGEVTSVGNAATIADDIIREVNLEVNSPTNTYVLTADSTAAGGMKWAAGGGGAHTEQEWDVYATLTPTPAVANTEAYMFTRKIDTDNDGLYIQMWKNGASETVQIA